MTKALTKRQPVAGVVVGAGVVVVAGVGAGVVVGAGVGAGVVV